MPTPEMGYWWARSDGRLLVVKLDVEWSEWTVYFVGNEQRYKLSEMLEDEEWKFELVQKIKEPPHGN